MTEVPQSFAPRRRMAAKSVGALTALALMAAACGSTATETVSAGADPESTEASSTGDAATPETADSETATAGDDAVDGAVDLSSYPAVVVKDIATGDDVEIAAILANGETPTLLWFWAPH